MGNMLGGILPEIVRPALKKKGGQKQRVGQKIIQLKYDQRHSNKRNLAWYIKKYHVHLREWWEMWDD